MLTSVLFQVIRFGLFVVASISVTYCFSMFSFYFDKWKMKISEAVVMMLADYFLDRKISTTIPTITNTTIKIPKPIPALKIPVTTLHEFNKNVKAKRL